MRKRKERKDGCSVGRGWWVGMSEKKRREKKRSMSEGREKVGGRDIKRGRRGRGRVNNNTGVRSRKEGVREKWLAKDKRTKGQKDKGMRRERECGERERAGLGRERREGREERKEESGRLVWDLESREGGKGTGKQESEEEEGRDNEARLLVYD